MTRSKGFCGGALALCAVILGVGPNASAADGPATSAAPAAFLSPTPHPALADSLALYGQFVGHWDVQMTIFPEEGPAQQHRGEWIFSYALEGRAIQDVWIVPPRAVRNPSRDDAGPYGTTIRFPIGDGRWRVVWLHPLRAEVTVMTAQRVGGGIVQDVEGSGGDRTRWVFYDITPDRFRWRAEEASPGGNWRRLQEMLVTRRPSTRPVSGISEAQP